MQRQIAMRLCQRASICQRPRQPALRRVQQDTTVRARHCITTALVAVQVVVRVNTVRRDQMRRLTVPASARAAMGLVRPVHVRPSVRQARTVQAVQQRVQIAQTSQAIPRTPVQQVIRLRRAHGPATVVITRRRITSVASSVVRV